MVDLDAGDQRVLFTNGIVEAENRRLEELGEASLRREAALDVEALDTQQQLIEQVWGVR